MEVNHERLPSLAAIGLIALRSGAVCPSRSMFLDCLQPAPAAAPPLPADSLTAPRAPDVEPPTEPESVDAAARQDDLPEEKEQKNDAPVVEAQAAPVVVARTVSPEGDAITHDGELLAAAAEELVNGNSVDTQAKAATEAEPAIATPADPGDQLPVCPIDAAVELPDLQAPTNVDEQLAEARLVADKHQRVRKHTSGEKESKEVKPEPSAQETAAEPATPTSPVLENTILPDLPEATPLELSSDDDSNSETAKETATTNVNIKAPPVAAETSSTLSPAAESSGAAGQPAADPAVAVTTDVPLKPPAVLLKPKTSAGDAPRDAGEIDPARFLSRVVKAFESAQQRDSAVRLRLHPAELGALSIEVKIQDSVLTASVQAETAEAKAAIVDNLPALRERLADQGIRIDQFDVDLMDHSDRRQQSLEEQARRQEERPPGPPRAAGRRVAASEPLAAQTTPQRAAGSGGLNVII